MRKFLVSILTITCGCLISLAASPMATKFTYSECEGSLMPYPSSIDKAQYPDSLTPVMINHVGRHGARFPASAANCSALIKALNRADSAATITKLGLELLSLANDVANECKGQWGALNSLGEQEQCAIAARMIKAYPQVFNEKSIRAISSYSPRAMMSMYAFLHQLDRLNNRIEVTTTSGRKNDKLMRPFDIDPDYLDFRKEEPYKAAYEAYISETCNTAAIERALGKDFPYSSDEEKQKLALTEYYVIAGLSAMGMDCDASKYFTLEEYNALWSCFNLRQYLQRTATTISAVPADVATDLLLDIIQTTDDFIDGKSAVTAQLRFGHAETLMPLLSLMRLPGCYYMTNYFDTVAQHWQDFHVVPMAANLQIVLFKSAKGRYYVRCMLNEKPIAIIPNSDKTIVSWQEARDFWVRCLPLIAQP